MTTPATVANGKPQRGDTTTNAEWPKPSQLGDELRPVKAFDEQLLPPSLRPPVADVSERMQTPPDFAAAAALVSGPGA